MMGDSDGENRHFLVSWSTWPFSSSICRPVPATCSMHQDKPWRSELFRQRSSCVEQSASRPTDTGQFAGRLYMAMSKCSYLSLAVDSTFVA